MPELPPKTADIDDPDRLKRFQANPFLDGPTEFLVKVVAEEISKVPQFKAIFGDFIEPYMRMDFPVRSLPALRIYNRAWTKEAESWFINGDLVADVIWPASIRRTETQHLPDTICAALCQQFRRPRFFHDQVGARVPGLNELGKIFSVEKNLGFEWADDFLPLTEITVNFRLDLRAWDDYLEDTYRTKDDPFEKTLEDLHVIAAQIQAMRDDNETEEPGVEVGITADQKT